MDSKLVLDKTATIKVDYKQLMADLEAIEPLISIFPKLESLTKLAPNAYEWKLKPIGAMGVSHAVHYAATYEVDKANGKLNFKGKEGVGNATLSGCFEFHDKGGEVAVEIQINGQLRDIKVPMLLKAATPGFIKTMFEGIVDRFIEKIGEKYGR
ncbi:SRPBCC domain-containing protein [Limnobacter humi]|uniref:SRPBCC domain-containing protein n=1 Tax=Limnobacter humi TaxID=1778671 RepID=A0ABT1WF25_9BURK|nr:SRPBCC domain-containing protein [Limnobacter humi]MCQ8896117.1 SRPBCC domain-containing protein [Limnobacter humi]